LVIGIVGFIAWSAADVDTTSRLRFEQPLRIPALLEPRADAAGRKVFELELEVGRRVASRHDGPHVGRERALPRATLRASRADTIVMRVRNRLPEATWSMTEGSTSLGVVFAPIGRLGDDILVNGTYDPHLRVEHRRRIRFRRLNASTARIYNVGFADRRPFARVATDGGLLERLNRMTRIQLSVLEPLAARAQEVDAPVARRFRARLAIEAGGSAVVLRYQASGRRTTTVGRVA
jgi:FtsP/CotA-like multicopper oxidase with cupredoxin domain